MQNGRTCGTCTECCKTHPVSELKKRAGKWCQFRVKEQGCRIYEERPKGCVEFECQWLKGHGAESDRPDLTGIVIDFFPLKVVGASMILLEGRHGTCAGEYGKALSAHYIDLAFPVLQRLLSGKEILLVPQTLHIPPERLKPLANDRRRVLIVEARSESP
ncbi:MAG: YkgJ family cysteine cluster protein [bacterium]|nr:YkgJ family cysteine cluster protein [bacterium]